MASSTGSTPADTGPVAPHLRFDVGALCSWLRDQVDGFDAAPPRVLQFTAGNSNPTYHLLAADGREWVLRRQPPGPLLPSAHAVDREFQVMRALAGTDVPVPRTQLLCEDGSVVGTQFMMYEHVPGRLFRNPALAELAPRERGALYDELARVLAALHRVDPAQVGLAEWARPGAYLARQVARWTRQYRASQTADLDAVERLIEWLPRNLPVEGETRIVHGDYRIENVIFHPTEPRIVAVIDWELATLGDPLVDMSYHCTSWHLPSAWAGLADLQPASRKGIPTEAEHLQSYLRHRGLATSAAPTPATWNYCLVFNLFRLLAILQGIVSRLRQGNAAGAQAVEAEARVRPLADTAWALAQRFEDRD
jgi:aminoglycoside phosphotransferase (APT) family kinase protein